MWLWQHRTNVSEMGCETFFKESLSHSHVNKPWTEKWFLQNCLSTWCSGHLETSLSILNISGDLSILTKRQLYTWRRKWCIYFQWQFEHSGVWFFQVCCVRIWCVSFQRSPLPFYCYKSPKNYICSLYFLAKGENPHLSIN